MGKHKVTTGGGGRGLLHASRRRRQTELVVLLHGRRVDLQRVKQESNEVRSTGGRCRRHAEKGGD